MTSNSYQYVCVGSCVWNMERDCDKYCPGCVRYVVTSPENCFSNIKILLFSFMYMIMQ